jgi:hypothetical protein
VKLLLAISSLLALVGCNATMPQQQSQQTAAFDPSESCFRGIPINPQLAAIAGKIPLSDTRLATVEILSNTESATEDERKVISLWAKYRTECAQAGKAYRDRNAPPGWAVAYEQGQMNVMQAIAALYAGGTYGAFNTQRQQIATQTQSGLTEASVRGAQQAAASRNAAVQNAALQNAQNMQMMQLLQSMQPPPRPMQLPQQTNCVTRYSGNTAYTSCN